MNTKRDWIVRALVGGAAMLLVMEVYWAIFYGSLINLTMVRRMGPGLAMAVQYSLVFLMGAGIGMATRPFSENGKKLLLFSVLHYLYLAVLFFIYIELIGITNRHWSVRKELLFLMTLLYVLIWVGRWLGWWLELDAIREKLGLLPAAPSRLRWRETLPYIGFAALLCIVVPALFIPVLSTIAYWIADSFGEPPAYYVIGMLAPLVVIAACPVGISLGKRRGFCPLYPLACGVFFWATVFICYHRPDEQHNYAAPFLICGALVLVSALAGNLGGAAWRRIKRKKGAKIHE